MVLHCGCGGFGHGPGSQHPCGNTHKASQVKPGCTCLLSPKTGVILVCIQGLTAPEVDGTVDQGPTRHSEKSDKTWALSQNSPGGGTVHRGL